MPKSILYTLGYRRWSASSRMACMVGALQSAGVRTLIDIRHSPCPSRLADDARYGPKDWSLLVGSHGIRAKLQAHHIEYLWLVELGNPQKNDREMKVLRSHLADGDLGWPVNRGLELLHRHLSDSDHACGLLCACDDYHKCHRKLVAEALKRRFYEGRLEIRDLSVKKGATGKLRSFRR